MERLPPELLHQIVGCLDLRSTVCLAQTARSLSNLVQIHPFGPLYLAVRDSNLKAFRIAVAACRSLFARLMGRRNRQCDWCCTILACVWYLVVSRNSTAAEWWSPLSLLVSRHTILPSPCSNDELFAPLFFRTVKAATARCHLSALKRLKQFKAEAVPNCFNSENLDDLLHAFLADVIRDQQQLWTQQQRLELIPMLIDMANGVDCLEVHPKSGHENFIDHVLATRDLQIIVAFILKLNDPGKHTFPHYFVDLMLQTVSLRESGFLPLLMQLYLVAISPLTTDPAAGLNIVLPRPVDAIRSHLAEQFAVAGVAPSQFDDLINHMCKSTFQHCALPWLLGTTGDKSRFVHPELDWLFSHVHLHVSMLHSLVHYCPNSYTPAHSPASLDLTLKHVPIDLAGKATHDKHTLHPTTHDVLEPLGCPRCAEIIRAARHQAQPNPALARFVSATWHVSYNPIPRDEWLAEARAVAQLVDAMAPVGPCASKWIDYVEFGHKQEQIIDDHAHVDRVDWWQVRAEGINRIDLAAVVVAYLHEDRVDEAKDVIRRIVASDDDKDAVDWSLVLDWLEAAIVRVGGPFGDERATTEQEQALGGFAHVVCEIAASVPSVEEMVPHEWLVFWASRHINTSILE